MAEGYSVDEGINLRLGAMRRTAQRAVGRLQNAAGQPRNTRQLGGGGVYVPTPATATQQTVVAGMRTLSSTTRQHLHYLQHQKGHEQSQALLFSKEVAAVDTERFVQEALWDPHQIRFVVSLPPGALLDRTQFTRLLMRQVERDVGRPLDWVAATHHDTAHLHTHVVLRGTDLQGKDLVFKHDYWTHGLRLRANHLATLFLGRPRGQAWTQEQRQALTEEVRGEQVARLQQERQAVMQAQPHRQVARPGPAEAIRSHAPQAQTRGKDVSEDWYATRGVGEDLHERLQAIEAAKLDLYVAGQWGTPEWDNLTDAKAQLLQCATATRDQQAPKQTPAQTHGQRMG